MSKLLTKTKPKADLKSIKASMVLAFHSTLDNPIVQWWSGVVNGPTPPGVGVEVGSREQYIVLQVPKEPHAHSKNALKVLKGYGIKDVEMVEGSSYNLLPINVEYLENCLPSRVTREWLTQEHDGPHDDWKKSVTAQLDQLGVQQLEMRYSGAGDSSNDDEWNTSRVGGQEVWYPNDWNDEVQKHWGKVSQIELPDTLAELISKYVWETLVQYDCVNNEGGGGDLKIDLTGDNEPIFTFSCYTNIHTTEDHAVDEEV